MISNMCFLAYNQPLPPAIHHTPAATHSPHQPTHSPTIPHSFFTVAALCRCSVDVAAGDLFELVYLDGSLTHEPKGYTWFSG